MFPRMIRMKKIPQDELKKALSWFCMIKYESLATFKELYEFVRESLLYARKFYLVSMILPEHKVVNKVGGKKLPAKALNDSVIRYQTPMNMPRSRENKYLTPNSNGNKDKQVFLSNKAVSDLEKTFKIFWNKYESDCSAQTRSKEDVFKDFKTQVKTALSTESALHILKLITEKLKHQST